MNQSEINVVLSLREELIKCVEPLTFVSNLFRSGYVRKNFYKSIQLLFKNGEKREEIISYVVDSLPFQVEFSALVINLDKCGYNKLAARLFLKLFEHNVDCRIHNSETESRTKLQTFFRNLKRMVHDSQFKNPRHALRSMAVRFKADLESEIDENRRQLLADRCVAIIGVEIDAFYDSLACESEITQEGMFSEMRNLIPHTSNPSVTETIYYTRQANMNAFHGNIEHAGSMLVQARSSAFNIENCLEITNMLYVEVYVKLWEFELNPSKAVLDSIMFWGRIGLASLETQCEATNVMWRRMFILRMVFALLGIGNRANIIPQYTVDPASLKEAQTLLAKVDKNWSGIEVRREMFYCVARARLNEQLQNFKEAKYFIDRAKLLALQGRFLEKVPFIDNFVKVIEEKRCMSRLNILTDMNEMSFPTTELSSPTVSSGLHEDDKIQVLASHNIIFNSDNNGENILTQNSEIVQSDVNCLHMLKSGGEPYQPVNENMLSGGDCHCQIAPCRTDNFTEGKVPASSHPSAGVMGLDIESLKSCTFTPSDHLSSVYMKTCHDSVREIWSNDSHSYDSNTLQKRPASEGMPPNFGELKLPGGNLVLCSNNSTTVDSSFDNMSTYADNSITEVKIVEEKYHSNYLRSDQSNQEGLSGNILRHQLLNQCHEGVEFGSVALFEDRSEGEGSSGIHLSQVRLSSFDQSATGVHVNTDETRNKVLKKNHQSTDIDDEELFGDGLNNNN